MIKNAVETLGYFSEQLAFEFAHCGIDTYFVDYDNLEDTMGRLPRFVLRDETALVTFNFIGLSGEEFFANGRGGCVWEDYGIRYFNILVDHPLYYHKRLACPHPDMAVYCVDREHAEYLRRFYPGIRVRFLPLAGNVLLNQMLPFSGQSRSTTMCSPGEQYDAVWNYGDALIPYERRIYDLVFTANYVPIRSIYRRIEALGPEYRDFYNGILEDLIENPAQSVDAVMERHIEEELGEISDSDKRAAMAGMLPVDLCVRAYFREEIIRKLAEQDIKIHVFGADWELLDCKKPWNIVKNEGMVNSAVCVRAVRNARISLNIMPWFKDGAHDRVFTAMLQKTVALTDESRFLRQELKDGENTAFFSLKERQNLPDLVRKLLAGPQLAEVIAENGYRAAYERHSWRERAKELMRDF